MRALITSIQTPFVTLRFTAAKQAWLTGRSGAPFRRAGRLLEVNHERARDSCHFADYRPGLRLIERAERRDAELFCALQPFVIPP
jgi:hypothetical protein